MHFFSGKYNEDGQEHISLKENEKLKRKIKEEQDSFLNESAMDVSQQMRESEEDEADERQHRCYQINELYVVFKVCIHFEHH